MPIEIARAVAGCVGRHDVCKGRLGRLASEKGVFT